MGIGAALGLGLVKGFTTAFQLEQQRRIEDEKKLDQLDLILANASVDPKAKGSQVAKLAETIKNARTEFDAKDPISLFGRPTNKVELELTDAQNIINSVEEYNSDFGHGIKLMSDFQNQPSSGSAIQALAEINSKLLDDTFRSTIAAGGEKAYSTLNSTINAAIAVINTEHLKGGANQSSLLLFGDPAEGKEGILDPYTNLFGDNSILKNMGTNINVPVTSPNKVIVDSENGRGKNVDSVNLIGETYDFKLKEGQVNRDMFNVYASIHNVDTAEAFQHYKQTYLGGLDVTNEQASDQLHLALAFRSSVQNPNAYNFTNVNFAENKKNALTFFPKLMNEAQGSPDEKFESVVFAIAPFISMVSSDLSNDSKKNFDTQGITLREYLEDRTKKEFKVLKAEDEANARVINDLERLYRLRASLKDPGALLEIKKFLGFVFDPDEGFVVRAASNIGGLVVPEERIEATSGDQTADPTNDEDLTEGYMTYLGNRVKDANKTGFAEFEALRIALAFKMARAEDPSGRLSNQDIELQMIRLGGNFMTRTYALTALEETIGTFKQNKASFEKVLVFANDTNRYTKKVANKFQILESALAVNQMLLNYNAAKKLDEKSVIPLISDQTQSKDETQKLSFPENVTIEDDQYLPGYEIAFDQNGVRIQDEQGRTLYRDKETKEYTYTPTLR